MISRRAIAQRARVTSAPADATGVEANRFRWSRNGVGGDRGDENGTDRLVLQARGGRAACHQVAVIDDPRLSVHLGAGLREVTERDRRPYNWRAAAWTTHRVSDHTIHVSRSEVRREP
jgi:hypothetical protein